MKRKNFKEETKSIKIKAPNTLPQTGVASGKCGGFTTLRKFQYKKPNFSI